MPPEPKVVLGQTYEDRRQRGDGVRQVKVVALSIYGDMVFVRNTTTDRHVWIKTERLLKVSRFRLVSEPGVLNPEGVSSQAVAA